MTLTPDVVRAGSLAREVGARLLLPSSPELESLWRQKYGPVETMGRLAARRHRFGYYLPADVYECLVAKILTDGARWLDVGGGQVMFAHNPGLAREVAARCEKVVAVDPSENVQKNTFAHETVQCRLEDYETDNRFDLATMRMVVEHVADADGFVAALAKLVTPGGTVVVLTVDRWSPTALCSRLVPFKLHYAVKRLFWDGPEEDTFPVHYRMNTHASLRRSFEQGGFSEEVFARPDDLSVFSRFRWLSAVELVVWRVFRTLRLPYPEGCFLAVYRRRGDE